MARVLFLVASCANFFQDVYNYKLYSSEFIMAISITIILKRFIKKYCEKWNQTHKIKQFKVTQTRFIEAI